VTTRDELRCLREEVSASRDEPCSPETREDWQRRVLDGVRAAARASAGRGLYAAAYLARLPARAEPNEVCDGLREVLVAEEGYTAADVAYMDAEYEREAPSFPGVAGLIEVMVTFAPEVKQGGGRSSR
jgi:hypothetical protein